MYKIAVAGIGYVGLVAGVVCFIKNGNGVTCVDINENKVNLMSSQIDFYIYIGRGF